MAEQWKRLSCPWDTVQCCRTAAKTENRLTKDVDLVLDDSRGHGPDGNRK